MIRMTLIGGQETIARFNSVSEQVYASLRAVIMEEWLDLQAYIVTSKLSGQVLKRRTGLLSSSINVGGPQTTSEFRSDNSYIVGKVGTNVVYAAIHEYGGQVHKVSSKGKSFTQNFPERSFLRSGLQDRQAQIRNNIDEAYRRSMRRLTVNG